MTDQLDMRGYIPMKNESIERVKCTHTVMNLGCGVQSTTLLLMALEGLFERPDYIIFADTGWEPRTVYDRLEWLQNYCATKNHKIEVVSADIDIYENIQRGVEGRRWASLPVHTVATPGEPRKTSMLPRRCTGDFKIIPICKFVRYNIMGLKKHGRLPKNSVEQWFGISTDESIRMKFSQHPGFRWRYPLIELNLSRTDCINWLAKYYPQLPPVKSACIGCPFRNVQSWIKMKRDQPKEYQQAVDVDAAIRFIPGVKGVSYLSKMRIPLDEAVKKAEETTPLEEINDFMNECSGHCHT